MTKTPSHKLLQRAASMTVIECTSTRYHVLTPEKRQHTVTISAIGGTCDCEAGSWTPKCSHQLAVKWFISQHNTAAQTAKEH